MVESARLVHFNDNDDIHMALQMRCSHRSYTARPRRISLWPLRRRHAQNVATFRLFTLRQSCRLKSGMTRHQSRPKFRTETNVGRGGATLPLRRCCHRSRVRERELRASLVPRLNAGGRLPPRSSVFRIPLWISRRVSVKARRLCARMCPQPSAMRPEVSFFGNTIPFVRSWDCHSAYKTTNRNFKRLHRSPSLRSKYRRTFRGMPKNGRSYGVATAVGPDPRDGYCSLMLCSVEGQPISNRNGPAHSVRAV
jgi:hypothetical protein